MSLTILGAHAGDVWIDREGDAVCLTRTDLAQARYQIHWFGEATRAGITLDESDVSALTKAADGPQLDDCHACEQPGLVAIEGRLHCLGHAAGYRMAEESA